MNDTIYDQNLEIVFGIDFVVEPEGNGAQALDGDVIEMSHLGEVEFGVDETQGRLAGLSLIFINRSVIILIVGKNAGPNFRQQSRQEMEKILESLGVFIQHLQR